MDALPATGCTRRAAIYDLPAGVGRRDFPWPGFCSDDLRIYTQRIRATPCSIVVSVLGVRTVGSMDTADCRFSILSSADVRERGQASHRCPGGVAALESYRNHQYGNPGSRQPHHLPEVAHEVVLSAQRVSGLRSTSDDSGSVIAARFDFSAALVLRRAHPFPNSKNAKRIFI